MKRIKKFNDFDDLDFISESRVYFMNDLLRKLRELRDYENNEWALKLLKSQGKNIDSDTTFLDLDGDKFSFSKESDLRNSLLGFMNKEEVELFFGEKEDYNSVSNYLGSYHQSYIKTLPNRGKVKMGKVIKKIIPEIPNDDLESLVNNLKSEQDGFEIKLVKGDEIAKYYKSESCDRVLFNYGTLQSSCMMDKESKNPNIFDIYTKNPDNCQLAVMLNKDGKLVGRALVWKIDEIVHGSNKSENSFYDKLDNVDWKEDSDNNLLRGKVKDLYFMDRVYYTKDWINNSFQKWAQDNNFMFKSRDYIKYKGEVGYPILILNIKKIAYRQFPYLDTFKTYDVQSAVLCNNNSTVGVYSKRGFDLTDTSGNYRQMGTPTQKKIDKATNYIRRFKDYLK